MGEDRGWWGVSWSMGWWPSERPRRQRNQPWDPRVLSKAQGGLLRVGFPCGNGGREAVEQTKWKSLST